MEKSLNIHYITIGKMNNHKVENLELIQQMYDFITSTSNPLSPTPPTFDEVKRKFYQSIEESEQIFFKHLYETHRELDYFWDTVEKDGLEYYCNHYYGFENISVKHVSLIINHYNLLCDYSDEQQRSIIEQNGKYFLRESLLDGSNVKLFYHLKEVVNQN